jgi:hypothetical protein
MCVITTAILSICAQTGNTNTEQLSQVQIDVKLGALKPLPKVHYYYSNIGGGLLDKRNSLRLYEYARITHALAFWGEWVKQQQVDNCVYTCEKINRTNPEIPASIAVFYNPWHRKFGKDLPPTNRGATYDEEIEFFAERLQLINGWLAACNNKYNGRVKLSAVLLDCERFKIKKDDTAWNKAMQEALDAIHMKAQEIFPNARVEWYDRGIRRFAGYRWGKSNNFTGKEIKAPLSCSLYTLPETECMRETYRRTCTLADALGIKEVTPWVALAAGYRQGLKQGKFYDKEWDYDLIYSYLTGAHINIKWYGDQPELFAPFNRAKVVVFYPPPFSNPHWAKHFIAYVRGATGVRELNDLGYEEE